MGWNAATVRIFFIHATTNLEIFEQVYMVTNFHFWRIHNMLLRFVRKWTDMTYVLGFKGRLEDKTVGDPDVTALEGSGI